MWRCSWPNRISWMRLLNSPRRGRLRKTSETHWRLRKTSETHWRRRERVGWVALPSEIASSSTSRRIVAKCRRSGRANGTCLLLRRFIFKEYN